MKAAIISNFFPPDFVGGAEIYAHRLAKELVKMGIDIDVITSTKSKREIIEIDGMKIFKVAKAPPFLRITGNFLGYNFNPSAYAIKDALDQIKPDVIHIHNINTTIMVYPLIRFFNAPVLVHIHDHWPICYTGTLYNMKRNEYCDDNCVECAFPPGFRTIGALNLKLNKKLMAQFEKNIDLFITPSNYLRLKLLEKKFTTEDKIMHLPLGIDLSEFSPGSQNVSYEPTVLFIGRLASYKNPALILKIFPKIIKHLKGKYQIIGKGPEIEKLRKLSVEFGIEKYVEIFGGVPFTTLLQKIKQASVLVVPSLWHENSPVVIYEAQACGTPVIVSNLGGPKELIDEGKSGYAIDPLDEKGWTEAILKILGNKDQRRKMGIEARKKAEREFDIKNNAKKILNIYENLVVSK